LGCSFWRRNQAQSAGQHGLLRAVTACTGSARRRFHAAVIIRNYIVAFNRRLINLNHKKPNENPKLLGHVIHAAHEEWLAFLSLLRFQWPLVLMFVCGVAAVLIQLRPLPPTVVRLATGQPQSSLDLLGKQYAGIFEKTGIQLELVPTAGAFENLQLLKQGKVDAAFSLGGMVLEADTQGIVSLGSVEYQPLWLFYRGPQYDGSNPTAFLKGKSFSINIPGSGTHNLSQKILTLHGIPIVENKNLLTLSSAQSVEAMLSGKIDGVFLLAGIESKTIQRLIADPQTHVFSFSNAEAYVKYFNFLEIQRLPRGAFSIVMTSLAKIRNSLPQQPRS